MLTRFGIAIRKIRLDRVLKLCDMAGRLGLTSAFVSAIETGRKPIPRNYIDSIAQALSLPDQEIRELRQAEDETRTIVQVGSLQAADRAMVATLARTVNELPAHEVDIIREFLAAYRGPPPLDSPANRITYGSRQSSERIDRLHSSTSGLERPFVSDAWQRFSFRVPPLPAWQIEEQADRCRALFLKKEQIWFPIVEVLEFALPRIMSDFNLEVYSADEISSEGKLLARSSTIIIHEDLYKEACTGWGRARFTLCHELGHFVLHKVFKATLDTQKRRGHRLYEDSEWQADRFASSLLVPRIHVSRFGDAEELTSQCGISRRAAEVRWSQLHTAENEIRLSRSQYTSSQPLKVPTEDFEKHCTNEKLLISQNDSEAIATELDTIGKTTAGTDIPQPLRQLLLQHISYLTWAIRNFDTMTIEGIRTAFEPAALQAIVEADVNKNSKSPDAQSLYQRLVTVTQKAVKALNLVDSGLKKTSNIRDDIDDLFE